MMLTGHTSRNEPNVGVTDAIRFACDSEDIVTDMPVTMLRVPAESLAGSVPGIRRMCGDYVVYQL